MKITNKFNLPKTIVEAVSSKHRKKPEGVYYVTELIDSPKIVELRRRHEDELEEDASDKIWSLLGKAVHSVLDDVGENNRLKEERFELNFPELNRTIVGRLDVYEEDKKKILSDYKVTSCWSVIYQSAYKKWEEQLNIYGYMLRQSGFEPDEAQVIAILRDWSKGKALRDSKYPPSQIQVVKLKLWSEEKQKEFIENKIKGLIAAEAKKEKDLPPCSPEDRWSKKDTYAVMKIGGKKALRVLATAEDAGKWAESYTVSNPKAKIEVQKREGGDIRCGDYCSCNKFCDYYKKKYGKQKPQEGQK